VKVQLSGDGKNDGLGFVVSAQVAAAAKYAGKYSGSPSSRRL
jgi:hypothetical protein